MSFTRFPATCFTGDELKLRRLNIPLRSSHLDETDGQNSSETCKSGGTAEFQDAVGGSMGPSEA